MINKALRTLWMFNSIFMFAAGMLTPLYAVYVLQITDNIVVVSSSWAVFLISTSIFMIIFSKIGDRVKEKEYLLMAGFLIRAIVWLAYIFVVNVPMLMVLQLLLGLGEAFGTPAYGSLVAEHLDKNRHFEEYSDMNVLFNVATGIAAIVGGIIVAKFGFPLLFEIMAALALFSFFGVLSKPRKLL